MNMAYTQSALGLGEVLDHLAKRARLERLECALPLIDTLRSCFSPEKTVQGVPSGVLTVNVWLELFNRWEEILQGIQRRRLPFLRDFFRESMTSLRLEYAHVNLPSSLIQALQELLAMMDAFLVNESHAKQAYQVA